MEQIASISLQALGSIFFLVFIAFGIASVFEHERRAVIVAFLLAVLGCSLFWGLSVLPDPLPRIAF